MRGGPYGSERTGGERSQTEISSGEQFFPLLRSYYFYPVHLSVSYGLDAVIIFTTSDRTEKQVAKQNALFKLSKIRRDMMVNEVRNLILKSISFALFID